MISIILTVAVAAAALAVADAAVSLLDSRDRKAGQMVKGGQGFKGCGKGGFNGRLLF